MSIPSFPLIFPPPVVAGVCFSWATRVFLQACAAGCLPL